MRGLFTVNVVITKVTLVAPAGTVALAGTVAAEVLLLVKETTIPLLGAAPFRVRVPVDEVAPTTVLGLSVSDERAGRLTVNVAVRVVLPSFAEMVTDAEVATGFVVTVKLAVVAPAATVTFGGTVAAAVLLLDTVTVNPPGGAAAVRVIVPVEELPPVTAVGFTPTDDNPGGAVTTRLTVPARLKLPATPVIANVYVPVGVVALVVTLS